MKHYLFIAGIIVFSIGCIAFDKHLFGLGIFIIGFSSWFFINSLLHYFKRFEKITDHERRINGLNLKSKKVNWVDVSDLEPHYGNYLLLFDGEFVCYGYYSAISNSFHVIDFEHHKKIIKWANIPSPSKPLKTIN